MKMSAEDLGKKVLGELEEVGLDVVSGAIPSRPVLPVDSNAATKHVAHAR